LSETGKHTRQSFSFLGSEKFLCHLRQLCHALETLTTGFFGVQTSSTRQALSARREIDWDRIVSIEYVGKKQVYDIEVEGTHNFIANGIVAHNTYLNGNLGIGTTAPQAKLDVNGSIYSRRYALTYTGTINVDWNNGNVQSVVLAGDATLTFANGQDGGKYILMVKQDGSGSRHITWPGTVRWGNGTGPVLTTTHDKTDYVGFLYNGVDTKYDGVATMYNMN
jgi:hypothetical protein